MPELVEKNQKEADLIDNIPKEADSIKEKRIKKELTRLGEIFKGIDWNDMVVIVPLLQNAAFMKVTLEELQEIINAEGATEEYQNGANQRGVKQSATLQSYNALIKNYASVIKALLRYVPSSGENSLSPCDAWQQRQKQQNETPSERKKRLQKEQAQWMDRFNQLVEDYDDQAV